MQDVYCLKRVEFGGQKRRVLLQTLAILGFRKLRAQQDSPRNGKKANL